MEVEASASKWEAPRKEGDDIVTTSVETRSRANARMVINDNH